MLIVAGPTFTGVRFDEVGSFGASIMKQASKGGFTQTAKFLMSWLHISKRLCMIKKRLSKAGNISSMSKKNQHYSINRRSCSNVK